MRHCPGGEKLPDVRGRRDLRCHVPRAAPPDGAEGVRLGGSGQQIDLDLNLVQGRSVCQGERRLLENP